MLFFMSYLLSAISLDIPIMHTIKISKPNQNNNKNTHLQISLCFQEIHQSLPQKQILHFISHVCMTLDFFSPCCCSDAKGT